ncbi:hypothetical protein ACOME3_002960 [Neoechinorhynchus agilis]
MIRFYSKSLKPIEALIFYIAYAFIRRFIKNVVFHMNIKAKIAHSRFLNFFVYCKTSKAQRFFLLPLQQPIQVFIFENTKLDIKNGQSLYFFFFCIFILKTINLLNRLRNVHRLDMLRTFNSKGILDPQSDREISK